MNSLTLIYHFLTPQNTDGEFRPASYKAIYCFSEQGFLEETLLHEMCKSVPEANYHDLTFLSLDDLKAFGLRVCQEVGASEVKLMSVLDYNIGVDGAKDINSFREVFSKFGETFQSENQSKKKGFFGKFF